MIYVVSCYPGLGQHVVHIYLHRLPHQILEHHVHKSLIGCSCIFEAEWHCLIVVDAMICDEGCVFLIVFVHRDLVIPRLRIHEV